MKKVLIYLTNDINIVSFGYGKVVDSNEKVAYVSSDVSIYAYISDSTCYCRLFYRTRTSNQKEAKVEVKESTLGTGEVVKDICPVMGSEVEKNTQYKVEDGGKVIGFCCESCIEEFNKDPDKYIQ